MLSYFHGVKEHVSHFSQSVQALGATMSGGKLEGAYNVSEIGKTVIGIVVMIAGAGIYYSHTQDHFDRLDKAVSDLQTSQSTSQTKIDTNIEDIKTKQQAQLITLTKIQTTLENQANADGRKERYNTTGAIYHKQSYAKVGPPKDLPDSGRQDIDNNATVAYNYYTQPSPYSHR